MNKKLTLKKEQKGILTIESLLLFATLSIVSIIILTEVTNSFELINAMQAARIGAENGIIMNNLAIYPKNSFEDYDEETEELLKTRTIKIIKIEYQIQEYNYKYQRQKIQLKAYVKCPISLKTSLKEKLGERINYNMRKNICATFNTENLSNIYSNPSFSDTYYFTTADVKWIV